MKIVVALDAFKGGMTAEQACRAAAEGIQSAVPGAVTILKPMADGGEGTAAALLASRPGGEWLRTRVQGPLPGRTLQACYAWFPEDRMAVVEMAAASGLPLLADHERDPLRANTFGTGQLLAAAIGHGARHILLTIGGSATVDGGIGAASALGWRFLDARGQAVTPDGGHLHAIKQIQPPPDGKRAMPPMTVLCDVTNPICGPQGAAAVFGPQKGATPEMVARLEDGLSNLAARIKQDLGVDITALPGGGAAGGLGAAAAAFFNAELAPGIDTVIQAAGLHQALTGADWCITGEGSFDSQSLHGKVVSGVAQAAAEADVPVAVFAGQVHVETETCRKYGIRTARAIQPPGLPLAESLRRAPELLRDAVAGWMKDED